MTTARLIIAILILLLALFVVAMNWSSVIVNMKNKRIGVAYRYSTVPIISFTLVALSYVIYPRPDIGSAMIIPLLDVANWRLLWLSVAMIRHPWKKEKH